MTNNDLYGKTLFKNRQDAGRKLGNRLKKLELVDPIILAIPSGGVPVGNEIAKILKAPLDIIITRKIQVPYNTEAGFGAVGINGKVNISLNEKLLTYLGLTKDEIGKQTEKTIKEIQRREKLFRGDKPFPKLENRDIIITDDGLASGHSMLIAVKLIKKHKPNRVIIAVPTSSGSAVKLVKGRVDKFISLYIHPENLPFAVASAYQKWHDLSDKEVLEYLKNLLI